MHPCVTVYFLIHLFNVRTFSRPTLGKVSMVITESSPDWFCSCPLRIRAAVIVVILIPDGQDRTYCIFYSFKTHSLSVNLFFLVQVLIQTVLVFVPYPWKNKYSIDLGKG